MNIEFVKDSNPLIYYLRNTCDKKEQAHSQESCLTKPSPEVTSHTSHIKYPSNALGTQRKAQTSNLASGRSLAGLAVVDRSQARQVEGGDGMGRDQAQRQQEGRRAGAAHRGPGSLSADGGCPRVGGARACERRSFCESARLNRYVTRRPPSQLASDFNTSHWS